MQTCTVCILMYPALQRPSVCVLLGAGGVCAATGASIHTALMGCAPCSCDCEGGIAVFTHGRWLSRLGNGGGNHQPCTQVRAWAPLLVGMLTIHVISRASACGEGHAAARTTCTTPPACTTCCTCHNGGHPDYTPAPPAQLTGANPQSIGACKHVLPGVWSFHWLSRLHSCDSASCRATLP